jgi:hypothetical protein
MRGLRCRESLSHPFASMIWKAQPALTSIIIMESDWPLAGVCERWFYPWLRRRNIVGGLS